MVKRGYVKVPRSVFQSEEWMEKRSFSRFEAMMSLYEQAAYTDGRLVHVRGVDVLLRRGQTVVSIRGLADLWRWGISSEDRFLKKIRDEKRDDLRIDINTVSGTVCLIVTVCELYDYGDNSTMCGTVLGRGTATGTEGDAVSGTATGTDEKCAIDSIHEYCECNDNGKRKTRTDMKYMEFSFELRTKGIYIEAGYQRFMVGFYEQPSLKYAVAVQWVRDQAGALPTLEQALVLCEHRAEINDALKAAGHQPIGDCHFWTRRRHAVSSGSVYEVNMHNGNIDRSSKEYYNAARAVYPEK